MEYDHGVRVTQHLHEMTPLERLLADFEAKAKNFHAKKNCAVSLSKEEERKAQRELQKLLKQLQIERLAAMGQASVQLNLDQYRAALRPADSDTRQQKAILRGAMGLEKHHPTKVLAKYMQEHGPAKPDKCFVAHHIVQGKGCTQFAAESRIDLHFHGIRINDPVNGAWMPRFIEHKGHPAMPNSNAHSEIHTKNYEHWVHSETHHIMSEQAFKDKLKSIRHQLRDGAQPDYVTEPPLKEVFKKV